jgi:hypothetical protein
VVPVGVLPRGELQRPDHLGTVGWWDGGATIGALHGSVVLAGQPRRSSHIDCYQGHLLGREPFDHP